MSFESTTLAALTASTPITTEVSTRIYSGTAPQDVVPSYIVFRRVSTDPTLSTDNGAPGSSELDNIRLEVSCHARTAAQANALAKLVRRALEAYRPTVYILQDIVHDYSDLPDTFQTVAEFSCWHPDTIPA